MALAAVVKVVYALAGGGLSQARPCLPESGGGVLGGLESAAGSPQRGSRAEPLKKLVLLYFGTSRKCLLGCNDSHLGGKGSQNNFGGVNRHFPAKLVKY